MFFDWFVSQRENNSNSDYLEGAASSRPETFLSRRGDENERAS
jgi:hypothetical protein